MIVEQVPGKLVEDAYKNTNLKIMHRLPAEEDRKVLGSAMTFGYLAVQHMLRGG